MKYDYVIGIDTGVHTGYALWNTQTKTIDEYGTFKIHEVLFKILKLSDQHKVLVRVEDARKRSNSSYNAKAMAQGVGSVKRDAKIFEDFLTDYKIDFQLLAPSKTTTKMSAESFAKFTGITKRTSTHTRDAYMLVFRFK